MAMGPEIGQAHVKLHVEMTNFDRKIFEAQQKTRKAADSMAASMQKIENATKRANAAILQGEAANKRAAASMLQAQTAAMRAAAATDRNTAAVKRHTAGIQALSRQFLVLRAAASGVTAVLGVRAVIQAADSWALMSARLRLVSGSAEEAARLQEQLFQVAQRSRVSLQSVGELFVRIRQATEEYGFSAEGAMQTTEGLAKIIAISGANAVEGASGLLQFTQGLTRGVAKGDELRSLYENLGGLFRVIGEQSGKSAQQVLAAALKNGLAVDTVINALLTGGDEIDKMFNVLPTTIEGAMQRIINSLQKMIGTSAQTSGALKEVTDALAQLNQTIDSPEFAQGSATILSFLAEGAQAFADIVSEIGYTAKALDFLAEKLSTMSLGDMLVTATSRDKLRAFFGDLRKETDAHFAMMEAAREDVERKPGVPVKPLKLPPPEIETDKFEDQLQKLRNQVVETGLPEHLEGSAKAATALNANLQLSTNQLARFAAIQRESASLWEDFWSSEEGSRIPKSLRAQIMEYATLTQMIDEATEARKREEREIAQAATHAQAEALRAQLDAGEQIRVSLEETRKKIQEVSDEGLLGSGEADAMQAQAVQEQVDAVTGSLDDQAAAKAKIRDTQAQINELVRQQAISEEEGARLTELNQKTPRDKEIESRSELPTDIEAADIAAQELSATLTDLENLSLESLAQSFQNIAQQIAQAVIQALIFKAIMAGTGAVAPTPGMGAGAGGGGAGLGTWTVGEHGLVFGRGGHLKRMARGGFITKRPMIMPMATGGALIGEAGPEAVMPLKRMASGNLGVASDGGGGGGAQQVNNIYANNIEPGTVSTLYNLANRAAPGAVVNARSRGLVRERKKPPF